MSRERCGAKTPTGPCRRYPPVGGIRCILHGGAAPQAKAAAAARALKAKTQKKAAKAVKTLGLRGDDDLDPTQVLLDEIAWTYTHVQWLRTKVQELEEKELIWNVAEQETGVGARGPQDLQTLKAEPSVWYDLYMRERQHLATITARAVQAGIEERRVKIAEQQGELVAVALNRILGALALTPPQWEQARQVIPRELRALSELDS